MWTHTRARACTHAYIIFCNCAIDDVLVRMMDDRTAETSRSLYGHNGPIYNLSFSPDRNLLLSCSEDATGKEIINCFTRFSLY